MPFTKRAERSGARIKVMIDGPSGSGKTMTALRIAAGLVKDGEIIAAIDTQNGQMLRYADQFEFYPEITRDYTPQNYVKMINEAERAKVGVLIIDSATHEWAACLDMVDAISRRTGSSNNGWRDVTPLHKKFTEAILQATVHIIVCVRTKTDWLYQEEMRGNRKVIVPHKVGTKPEQRDQFEFDFDLWLRMDREHTALIEKSVFDFLETGTDISKPGEDVGVKLREWIEGTAYDAEAVLDARDRDDRATGQAAAGQRAPSREGATRGNASQATPAARTASKPTATSQQATDPDPEPEANVGHDMEDDDDADEPDEMSDEDYTKYAIELEARYRTLVAVAVVNEHKDRFRLASAKLEDIEDKQIEETIRTLERSYKNVETGAGYQCDKCGEYVYPHTYQSHDGHEIIGLNLIAISIRDFGRVLCAKDIAAEKRKPQNRRASR